jgi:hypothetical protein
MNLLDIFTENKKIGGMPADKFDAAMARLKQRASQGPLKTVWDPVKRVYKNVPVNPPKPGMSENSEEPVGFHLDTELAYQAVMRKFGNVVSQDPESGTMYVPASVWTQVEKVAFDADGRGAERDEGVMEEGWKGALAGAALAGLGVLSGAPAQAADLSNFNTQYLQQVVSGEHSRPMVSVDDARAELQARVDGKQQAAPARPAQSQAAAGYSKEWLQKAADPNRTGRYMISVEKAQELLGNMQEGIAEGSLNELSKNTLKSYSRERGTTIHQDKRDADRARDTAADKKKHGNTKAAADWDDEASWLDKRAEKGAKGVAQAAIKIAKKGMAEGFNAEYDDEAGMAHTNLHTIARDAQSLLDIINSHENLPEWVQEKIVKAQAMLSAAWDYLKSQEEQGIDPRMGMNEMSGVGGVKPADLYRQVQTFKKPPATQRPVPQHVQHAIDRVKRDPKYTLEQRAEIIQNLISQHTIDRKIGEDISVDGRALEAGAIVYNGAIGVGEVLGSDGRSVRVRNWEGRENRLAPSTVRFVANRETQPTLYTWKGRPQVGVLDRLNQRFQERDQALAEQHLAELSFLGSECTKDCSGHRAGYEWSHRKGLRQGNSPYSPSFNKGAALAVAGK